MRRSILILAVVLITGGPAAGQFNDLPDHSLLWNTFSSFREVDGYAIATTDFGLAVLEYEPITERYKQVGQLITATQPFTCKISDSVLAVRTWADIVYFVNISDLPNLTLLGQADFAFPFYDVALNGRNLYIAAGFEGLLRYRMTDYNDAVLTDSLLTGVHCVQADIYGDELLVLDDYNGIMRYDLSAPGFGDFVDYFWLPLRAQAFARSDSTLAIPLYDRKKMFIGHYATEGPVITDTIDLVFNPQTAMIVDTMFLALSSDAALMQTIGRQSLTGILASLPSSVAPYLDGSAVTIGTVNHLVLPSDEGGLWDYNLDDLWFNNQPKEAYDSPGPIVDARLGGDKLITAGRNNPLQVYTVPPDHKAVLDTTLFGLIDVGSIAEAGSVYFAHYPDAGSVFAVRVENGSIEIINTIDIGTSAVSQDLQFYDTDPVDTLDALLVLGGSKVSLYGITDAWEAVPLGEAQSEAEVLDAIVVDSFLVFSSANDQLHGYKIFSDFAFYHWWTISTPEPIHHLISTGPRVDPDGSPLPELLLGFSGAEMYTIDIPNVEVATIEYTTTYPLEITSSAVFNNALYTVGDFGMGLLDLAYDPPVLVEQWGYPGISIDVDSSTIAITDGSAVHLYPRPQIGTSPPEPSEPPVTDGRLSQNYPNPFNPSTTIDYYLPEAAPVEITILNVLGQTIITLVNETVPAGRHSVTWDGVDDAGQRVASGVYFYRLTTPDRLETKKMVVLK